MTEAFQSFRRKVHPQVTSGRLDWRLPTVKDREADKSESVEEYWRRETREAEERLRELERRVQQQSQIDKV